MSARETSATVHPLPRQWYPRVGLRGWPYDVWATDKGSLLSICPRCGAGIFFVLPATQPGDEVEAGSWCSALRCPISAIDAAIRDVLAGREPPFEDDDARRLGAWLAREFATIWTGAAGHSPLRTLLAVRWHLEERGLRPVMVRHAVHAVAARRRWHPAVAEQALAAEKEAAS